MPINSSNPANSMPTVAARDGRTGITMAPTLPLAHGPRTLAMPPQCTNSINMYRLLPLLATKMARVAQQVVRAPGH
jgi:hypothetical protein